MKVSQCFILRSIFYGVKYVLGYENVHVITKTWKRKEKGRPFSASVFYNFLRTSQMLHSMYLGDGLTFLIWRCCIERFTILIRSRDVLFILVVRSLDKMCLLISFGYELKLKLYFPSASEYHHSNGASDLFKVPGVINCSLLLSVILCNVQEQRSRWSILA